MTDLGGNTELVRQQRLQSPKAGKAGIAVMTVHGETPRGMHPAETAVPPALYIEELRRRGLALREGFDAR